MAQKTFAIIALIISIITVIIGIILFIVGAVRGFKDNIGLWLPGLFLIPSGLFGILISSQVIKYSTHENYLIDTQ